MNDVADVERSQAVVERNSGAGNIRSPEALRAPAVEQITGVGTRLRPSVGRQETQAICELFLRFGLKASDSGCCR